MEQEKKVVSFVEGEMVWQKKSVVYSDHGFCVCKGAPNRRQAVGQDVVVPCGLVAAWDEVEHEGKEVGKLVAA